MANTATTDAAERPGHDEREATPSPHAGTWLVIAVCSLVVLYVIAHALLLNRFPWFSDEGIYGRYTQLVEGDRTQRFAALVDHKGLINTWLAAVVMKFGASPIEGLRVVAGLSGAVTALATGLMVGRWRSPRDGWWAGALTLFVPFLFVHSAVGVHDEFVAAGSAVALMLQLSLVRQPRLDRALLLGITFGLLLLSKPTGAIAIALVPVSLLVFDWRAEGARKRLIAWAGAIALSLFIGLAIYSLTRLSPLAYTPAPPNHRSLSSLLSDPFGSADPGNVLAALIGYITPLLLLVALWGCARAIVTRDRVGLVLIVWTGAALIAYVTLTVSAYPRYGLQMASPLCALAVLGGVDLWERVTRRWSSRAAWALTALVLAPVVVFDLWMIIDPQRAPYAGLDRQQYVYGWTNQQPAREAGKLILSRSPAQFGPATPARDRTVAVFMCDDSATWLTINGDKFSASPRFQIIREMSPVKDLNDARFLLVTDGCQIPGLDRRESTIVKVWHRPDHGAVTTLYDRGAS